MSAITITLTGTEKAAPKIDGANAFIRNDGVNVIYAAKKSGIIPGADGVISIPAGTSAAIYGINGGFYLLGTGSAMVVSSDYTESPFKSSAQSGSGADETARAAINSHIANTEMHITSAEKAAWNAKAELSDIPTSLPANGGNADTLGGLSPDEFVRNNGTIRFIPFNMKYREENGKICLYSDDDSVSRGIYIRNQTGTDLKICILVSATGTGALCQCGYGTGMYPGIQDTGDGREWFDNKGIPTTPTVFEMNVPAGKLGYFGFYGVSESATVILYDAKCPSHSF